MRSLALAVLLSLAAFAFAENNSADNNLQSQNATATTTAHHRRFVPNPRYDAKAHSEDESDGVCYTMRTYYFERQDGNAPVPNGMTTCTRTSQRDLKQADRVHVPQLIPATK